MRVLRAEWVKFKKKYPAFEKARQVKADVGPLLDQYHKQGTAVVELANQIKQKLQELELDEKKIDNVISRYGDYLAQLATQMKKEGKTNKQIEDMGDDFDKISDSIASVRAGIKRDVRVAYKGASDYSMKEWSFNP